MVQCYFVLPLPICCFNRGGIGQRHCDNFLSGSVMDASVLGRQPPSPGTVSNRTGVLKVVFGSNVAPSGETADGSAGTRAVRAITGSRVRQNRFFGSSWAVRFGSFLFAFIDRRGRIYPSRLGNVCWLRHSVKETLDCFFPCTVKGRRASGCSCRESRTGKRTSILQGL